MLPIVIRPLRWWSLSERIRSTGNLLVQRARISPGNLDPARIYLRSVLLRKPRDAPPRPRRADGSLKCVQCLPGRLGNRVDGYLPDAACHEDNTHYTSGSRQVPPPELRFTNRVR
jgi:hypothetical protein